MTVLITAAGRSPFTAIDGALAGWHPVDLAAHVMQATLRRAGAAPEQVDEVWVGCAEPVGAQGADMARAAILTAGWPDRISGTVVDRAETSGTAALHAAVAAIESGAVSTAMVVGVCGASTVAPGASALGRIYGRPWGDGAAERVDTDGGLLPPPAAADRAARLAGIDRAEQDAWAAASHERRSTRTESSLVAVDARPGERVAIQRGTPLTVDDHRAPPAEPGLMPPCFDPGGTVTGFTCSPPVDGVTALLLTATAPDAGLASVVGIGRGAGHPLDPLGGLERAVATAMRSAGCDTNAVSRWEIGEPTAAATLSAIRRLDLDPELVNPGGGTLGVGDAGAAEELRLLVDPLPSPPGSLVAAVAFGPTGAAVTIVQTP